MTPSDPSPHVKAQHIADAVTMATRALVILAAVTLVFTISAPFISTLVFHDAHYGGTSND